MMTSTTSTSHANTSQTLESATTGEATAFEQNIDLLDRFAPLCRGSHRKVTAYGIYYQHLVVRLDDGTTTGLKRATDFLEAYGRRAEPESIVLGCEEFSAEIELTQQGCPQTVFWTTKRLPKSAA